MKKDQDYDDYNEYIRSLYDYLQEVVFTQEVQVAKIMGTHDELESLVASRPCYNSVQELMDAVKEI